MLGHVQLYYRYYSLAGVTLPHLVTKTSIMYMYFVGACYQNWHNRAGMPEG